MGYTTNFKGQFALSSVPDASTIVLLNAISQDEMDDAPPGHPTGYCQWELSRNCRLLEWDGNEKFRDYVEWLQYLMDKVLLPTGITLSGSVEYQGEYRRDRGTLAIVDGKAVQTKKPVVADTLEELKAFRDFVMENNPEVVGEWLDSRK